MQTIFLVRENACNVKSTDVIKYNFVIELFLTTRSAEHIQVPFLSVASLNKMFRGHTKCG